MRICALIGVAAALVTPQTPSRAVRRRAADTGDEFDRRRAADTGDEFEVVGSQTVSLKSQFERALVLQRAGDLDGALDEYKAFIDAAEEHNVPPAAYAEVRGNVGALLLKRGDLAEAAAELEASIALRDLATTRCNLAIIRIRQSDAAGAREHARAALRLGDESDSRTGTVARRILADVEVLEDQAK